VAFCCFAQTRKAYPSGEASGDSGWLASLELRYAVLLQVAVSVFLRCRQVNVNTNPYLTTANKKSLAGAGIGLSGEYEAFNWRTTLAWRNGDASTAEPDKKPRLWVQAGWRF
jgi:hemolysin activation/secretion protein